MAKIRDRLKLHYHYHIIFINTSYLSVKKQLKKTIFVVIKIYNIEYVLAHVNILIVDSF